MSAEIAAAGLGVGLTIFIVLLCVVVGVIYGYFSFKGMVKLGICEDSFGPYFIKTLANSLSGGLLGLIAYFVK